MLRMCKNLETGLREQNFFKAKEFFKNFDLCRNEIDVNNGKYALGSAMQFPTKWILRPMVFTKTTRQRGGRCSHNT